MGAKCQSCGMLLSRDANGGGTEMNGSLSSRYCSFCYRDGLFLNPEFSVSDMKAYRIECMARRGMPRLVAWMLARGIPKLERWRSRAE